MGHESSAYRAIKSYTNLSERYDLSSIAAGALCLFAAVALLPGLFSLGVDLLVAEKISLEEVTEA